MKKILSYGPFLLLILFVISCGKDENQDALSANYYGADYFPDDSGIVRFYHIDSIYWDDFSNTHDTLSYEIKEVLAGHFIDGQGRNAMRIERFRQDSTGNWNIYRVWNSVRTQTSAEVVEENTRYVKLRFPAATGSIWNGNVYNTEGEQNYEILTMDVPEFQSGFNFTQTLHVLEENTINAIEVRKKEAKYAKFTGAYFKSKTSLTFEGGFGQNADTSGFIYTEKLTHYTLP